MASLTDATSAIARRLAMCGPYPVGRFRDRGIVVCAGGVRMFVNAYVLLRMLRETLGCRLPVQVWHLGAEELSPIMRVLLERIDRIEVIDAFAVGEKSVEAISDGWQLKAFAVLHSRFREVLLLDADQVPVRDPEEIFGWAPYVKTGALFWPDIVDIAATNPIWAVCGLEPRRVTSFESGQLVIDKHRHWAALSLALFFNEEADTFHRLVYGDKDTFLIAWLLTGAPHALVPHPPYIDARCLVQRDFAGVPMFQHRTNAKWSYAHSQVELPNFIHQNECLRILKELRVAWNGRMFHPPARSMDARVVENGLLGRWRLIGFGEPDLQVEFLPGHQFGIGRGPGLQNWYVTDGHNGLELVIRDADCDTYRLSQYRPRHWSGRKISPPETDVFLHPVSDHIPLQDDVRLISELVEASGLANGWNPQRHGELRGALRLIERIEPGNADRLRGLAFRRYAHNDPLRKLLLDMADELWETAHAGRPEGPRTEDVLGTGYVPRGWRR